MNIQPISTNQNRQQNFGMNLKVVAEQGQHQMKVVEQVESIIRNFAEYLPDDLRGKLTIAMRQAGNDTLYAKCKQGVVTLTPRPFPFQDGQVSTAISSELFNPQKFPPIQRESRVRTIGEQLLSIIKDHLPQKPEEASTGDFLGEINFSA